MTLPVTMLTLFAAISDSTTLGGLAPKESGINFRLLSTCKATTNKCQSNTHSDFLILSVIFRLRITWNEQLAILIEMIIYYFTNSTRLFQVQLQLATIDDVGNRDYIETSVGWTQ
jgi:hypothetical protein